MKNTIYITGYPKSGTTWLALLMGRSLDCPVGAFTVEHDKEEPATIKGESDRYVIRKGHFRLSDKDSPRPVYPDEHILFWKALLPDDKIVHIVRDPRDIAISYSKFWHTPLPKVIQEMGEGSRFEAQGPWVDYVSSWINFSPHFQTFYEILRLDTERELQKIFFNLGIEADSRRVHWAVMTEDFAARRLRLMKREGEVPTRGWDFWLRLMRKGVPGDWVNHFDEHTRGLAKKYFGETLLELGYVQTSAW